MNEAQAALEAKLREKIQAFQSERWISPVDMIELLLNETQRRIELNQKWEAKS